MAAVSDGMVCVFNRRSRSASALWIATSGSTWSRNAFGKDEKNTPEGKGWYPVDISEADKAPDKRDYYFGTLDPNRVDIMVGRDFNLEGYELESANLFIYPLMEVDDKKSNAFTKSFYYKSL